MTGSMNHQSIDVAIGRDAEARWKTLHERKAVRDKIRRESGKPGITAVGKNEFVSNNKTLVAIETPEPKND